MAEKYDLKKMLKEIKEDEKMEGAVKKRGEMSQEAIKKMMLGKRNRKKKKI